MKMKALAVLVLLVFLHMELVYCQDATRGVSVRLRSENGQGREVKLYERSYALVIGNSDYRNGWRKLPGVLTDVKAVESTLTSQGFEVEVLTDVSRYGFRLRVEKFINKYGLDPNNRLLIYFAGHGFTENFGPQQVGYIVMVDAPPADKDFTAFQQSSVEGSEIEALAKRIKAKHTLFVFDSCFSGALTRTRGTGPPKFITEVTTKPVRQFITSGTAKQEVPDVSTFRVMFERGIRGEADFNHDTYVTGSELGLFLEQKVSSYTDNKQTPQYSKIRDVNLDEGDFVFLTGEEPKAESADSSNMSPECAKVEGLNARGDELMGQKRYEQALAEYDKAIALSPRCATSYKNKGKLFAYRKDWKQSVELFSKAIALDSNDALSLAGRGVLYAQNARTPEDYRSAVKDLSRVIEITRDEPPDANLYVFFWRGRAYVELKDYEKAIDDFDHAINIDPKNADAYLHRGHAYLQSLEFKLAVEDYAKAVELNPRDDSFHHQLGYALMFKAVLDDNKAEGMWLAIKSFTRALELNPANSETLELRAKAYLQIEDYDSAIADYKKMSELDPKDPAPHSLMAKVYLVNKDQIDLAIASSERAVSLDPGSPNVYHNRSVAYFVKAGREKNRAYLDKALSDMNRAIALGSDDPESFEFRARYYDALGEKDKAVADRKKAKQLKSQPRR